jgi:lipopolysaccharide export system protein LptA
MPKHAFLSPGRVLLALTCAALTPRPAVAVPAWRIVLAADPGGTRIVRLAPPRVSLPQLGEEEVVIEAGDITRDQGPIVATGGVTVTQGTSRLTADRVTADPDVGEVVAEGSVVFTEPGRTVRGARIIYNTDTRRVRATAAETVVQGVILRAHDLDATAAKATVQLAIITTCDLPRPHYRFTARSVVFTPNDRIVARHVGVWLLGVRLFVVPRLEARVGAGREEGGGSPFPRVGANRRDGPFLDRVFPLIADSTLSVDLDTRLSVHRGLTGGFEAATPLGRSLQLIGALKYRDEAPNQRTRFLEVDRLPEVGVLWVSPAPRVRGQAAADQVLAGGQAGGASGGGGPTTVPAPAQEPARRPIETAGTTTNQGAAPFRPLRQVGADVAHQPGLLRPAEKGRWYLRAQTTLGFFHQREGSAIGGPVEGLSRVRLDFRATGTRSGLRVAGLTLPVLQFFLRHSIYDDGNGFTVLGLAARQDWRLGPRWSTGLRIFEHQTTGVTPFRFDRVEIRTELQPNLSYTAGGTTLSWLGRMDVDRRQLFDQEYAIARVFHCLEPRFSYHTRRRQFGLDIRIVGLEFD